MTLNAEEARQLSDQQHPGQVEIAHLVARLDEHIRRRAAEGGYRIDPHQAFGRLAVSTRQWQKLREHYEQAGFEVRHIDISTSGSQRHLRLVIAWDQR